MKTIISIAKMFDSINDLVSSKKDKETEIKNLYNLYEIKEKNTTTKESSSKKFLYAGIDERYLPETVLIEYKEIKVDDNVINELMDNPHAFVADEVKSIQNMSEAINLQEIDNNLQNEFHKFTIFLDDLLNKPAFDLKKSTDHEVKQKLASLDKPEHIETIKTMISALNRYTDENKDNNLLFNHSLISNPTNSKTYLDKIEILRNRINDFQQQLIKLLNVLQSAEKNKIDSGTQDSSENKYNLAMGKLAINNTLTKAFYQSIHNIEPSIKNGLENTPLSEKKATLNTLKKELILKDLTYHAKEAANLQLKIAFFEKKISFEKINKENAVLNEHEAEALALERLKKIIENKSNQFSQVNILTHRVETDIKIKNKFNTINFTYRKPPKPPDTDVTQENVQKISAKRKNLFKKWLRINKNKRKNNHDEKNFPFQLEVEKLTQNQTSHLNGTNIDITINFPNNTQQKMFKLIAKIKEQLIETDEETEYRIKHKSIDIMKGVDKRQEKINESLNQLLSDINSKADFLQAIRTLVDRVPEEKPHASSLRKISLIKDIFEYIIEHEKYDLTSKAIIINDVINHLKKYSEIAGLLNDLKYQTIDKLILTTINKDLDTEKLKSENNNLNKKFYSSNKNPHERYLTYLQRIFLTLPPQAFTQKEREGFSKFLTKAINIKTAENAPNQFYNETHPLFYKKFNIKSFSSYPSLFMNSFKHEVKNILNLPKAVTPSKDLSSPPKTSIIYPPIANTSQNNSIKTSVKPSVSENILPFIPSVVEKNHLYANDKLLPDETIAALNTLQKDLYKELQLNQDQIYHYKLLSHATYEKLTQLISKKQMTAIDAILQTPANNQDELRKQKHYLYALLQKMEVKSEKINLKKKMLLKKIQEEIENYEKVNHRKIPKEELTRLEKILESKLLIELINKEISQALKEKKTVAAKNSALTAQNLNEIQLTEDEIAHITDKVKNNFDMNKNTINVYNFGHATNQPNLIAVYLGTGQGKSLGAGAFGAIKISQDLSSGEFFALKKMKQGEVANNEIEFYQKFSTYPHITHPGLNHELLPIKLQPGKDLDKSIIKTPSSLTEIEALRIICNMLQEMIRFNDNTILHRDIKSDNFMYDPLSQKVTPIDLGLSQELMPNQDFYTEEIPAGTKGYMAAEILNEPPLFTEKSEVYALGVTFARMLGLGKMVEDYPNIHLELTNLDYSPKLKDISKDRFNQLLTLIKSMLAEDLMERPSLKEALKSFHRLVDSYDKKDKITSVAILDVDLFFDEYNKTYSLQQPWIADKELKEPLKGLVNSLKFTDQVWLMDRDYPKSIDQYLLLRRILENNGVKLTNRLFQVKSEEKLSIGQHRESIAMAATKLIEEIRAKEPTAINSYFLINPAYSNTEKNNKLSSSDMQRVSSLTKSKVDKVTISQFKAHEKYSIKKEKIYDDDKKTTLSLSLKDYYEMKLNELEKKYFKKLKGENKKGLFYPPSIDHVLKEKIIKAQKIIKNLNYLHKNYLLQTDYLNAEIKKLENIFSDKKSRPKPTFKY